MKLANSLYIQHYIIVHVMLKMNFDNVLDVSDLGKEYARIPN